MAKPRALEELEFEVFDWGLELKNCITGIGCGVCPETRNPKCPGNKRMDSRKPDLGQFIYGLPNGCEQKMAA